MNSPLRYEVRDRVAWLTLDRPQSLNALNLALFDALEARFRELSADPQVLAAVVHGAGERAFSTGADLKEAASGTIDVMDRVERDTWPYVSKPLIAAIHGFCLAGGFELALRCDIRIATPDAEFGMPEPRWCLMGGYGLHHLSRMIPMGEAMYLQLTGQRIGAQRAHEIGLVQCIVPRSELLGEAARIATAIARNAPLAVQGIKRVVSHGRHLPVEASQKFAAPIERQVYASEDSREGPRAFAEKREPRWQGR
ncbi:MAG: enoyl-CoA hydratase-related protein [Gammaproteobacteria bacterium]